MKADKVSCTLFLLENFSLGMLRTMNALPYPSVHNRDVFGQDEKEQR